MSFTIRDDLFDDGLYVFNAELDHVSASLNLDSLRVPRQESQQFCDGVAAFQQASVARALSPPVIFTNEVMA